MPCGANAEAPAGHRPAGAEQRFLPADAQVVRESPQRPLAAARRTEVQKVGSCRLGPPGSAGWAPPWRDIRRSPATGSSGTTPAVSAGAVQRRDAFHTAPAYSVAVMRARMSGPDEGRFRRRFWPTILTTIGHAYGVVRRSPAGFYISPELHKRTGADLSGRPADVWGQEVTGSRRAPTALRSGRTRRTAGALSADLPVGEFKVPGLAGAGPLRSPVVMLRRGMRAAGRRFAWSCQAGQRCRGSTCRGR